MWTKLQTFNSLMLAWVKHRCHRAWGQSSSKKNNDPLLVPLSNAGNILKWHLCILQKIVGVLLYKLQAYHNSNRWCLQQQVIPSWKEWNVTYERTDTVANNDVAKNNRNFTPNLPLKWKADPVCSGVCAGKSTSTGLAKQTNKSWEGQSCGWWGVGGVAWHIPEKTAPF